MKASSQITVATLFFDIENIQKEIGKPKFEYEMKV